MLLKQYGQYTCTEIGAQKLRMKGKSIFKDAVTEDTRIIQWKINLTHRIG